LATKRLFIVYFVNNFLLSLHNNGDIHRFS